MRDINELNLVGSTDAENRRVETKDDVSDNQEIVVRYPRPSAGLDAEEKARFASLAAKGLAHIGFESGALAEFTQASFRNADAAPDEDECLPDEVIVDGVTYVRA